MAETAGKDTVIKISGAATAMVGEATSSSDNTVYQITSTSKQVLDRTGTIRVHKFSANGTAEATTSTTNIKITGHGLVTGDLIINTSRSNAARLVTKVDDNNVTVTAVTDQAAGDTIGRYPTEAAANYTLNRLNSKITYGSALSRTIKVSGDYLPMSTAAYANSMSLSKASELYDRTAFGAAARQRLAGLKSASGTLTQLNIADTTYSTALAAGVPIVIEHRSAAAAEPTRFWAMLDSDELAAAVGSLQNETVTWVSYDEWINLGG